MIYNKDEIKNNLTLEQIFELLTEFGGDPEYSNFGILCSTICHNPPGEGSRKLYFYSNSKLFQCYTGCEHPSFDIFELIIKVADIQWHKTFKLNDALYWIAQRFGLSGENSDLKEEQLQDWDIFSEYERVQEIKTENKNIVLKSYNPAILERFNYKIEIVPWLEEGITQEVLNKSLIGFYPGGDQITIPHFDINGRFIGLRGRTICQEDAERFGKYRPIKVNNILYNHPLGMNLYNLNNSKNTIQIIKKAIIFEGEKSTLKYRSYFGIDNDISVACCGSSLSSYQVQLLLNLGVKELIIAFDRQFQDLNDSEASHLENNLRKIHERFKNDVLVSFMFDKYMITGYKDSPIDCGLDTFLKLYKERIIL